MNKPANFRAEPCKFCGTILNGNEPMLVIKHWDTCPEREGYVRTIMKRVIHKHKNLLKRLKDSGD